MEGFLQITLGVIILFFCGLCIYSIIRMLRDTTENREQPTREREVEHIDSAELSEIITRTATALADAKSTAQEDKPTEAFSDTAEGGVVFSKHSPSMEEKYAALSPQLKIYFDEIVSHAVSKDGTVEHKFAGHYDYKIGAYRLLRITVKRGEILCELRFLDREVLEYLSESEVKIKQSASSIRVSSPAAVVAVREGIDLVFSQITEDREYKKSLAREKRRERQRKTREEEKASAATSV